MTQNITLAMSIDFLRSFSKLPQVVQAKVVKFSTNFQIDPTAPGINYEKIRDARDKNMRSVRIDQDFRGILLKPDNGNVYLLLWVDHHDAAYAWAQRHRVAINAQTGAIQVFCVETRMEQEAVVVPAPAATVVASGPAPAASPNFRELADVDLMRVGVPQEMLESVRVIDSEDALDRMQDRLPPEAYEALFMIAAGDTVSQILTERETRVDKTYDTEDFAAALTRVESRSAFMVVENETALATALDSSLSLWRIFLHPTQLKIVNGEKSGSFRVLGGAGTGKTVVAMHRARWLAEHFTGEGERILFTTFTKNLAIDIEENLKQLCTKEAFARIRVINLDAWVHEYLKQENYEFDLIFKTEGELWNRAMTLKPDQLALPDSFYREEWQRIIQAQGVETLEQYKTATRVGRGTSISRSDRVRVWPVFEEYRNQLTRHGKKEINDAYRDAAALLEKSRRLPYAAVVVDEAQDMGVQAFRLIRAIARPGKNDLFLVGDGHQRIYGRNKVVLSGCGIDIRGRARKLRLNYRTTEEIRKTAVGLLEGLPIDDLDGGLDEQKKYKSLTHGDPPQVLHFPGEQQQDAALAAFVKEKIAAGTTANSICIAARTNAERDRIAQKLVDAGVPVFKLEAHQSDHRSRTDQVRIATFHRVKGLEFDIMILASVNDGLVPIAMPTAQTADPVERQERETEERSLLYVGLTRARKQAVVMSYGTPSPFVKGM